MGNECPSLLDLGRGKDLIFLATEASFQNPLGHNMVVFVTPSPREENDTQV